MTSIINNVDNVLDVVATSIGNGGVGKFAEDVVVFGDVAEDESLNSDAIVVV